MSAKSMRAAYDKLYAAGLRPLLDYELEVCRAECPSCGAGARDPDALFLPLAVCCHGHEPVVHCSAGCPDHAIVAALEAGPMNWRALAEELFEVASRLAVMLDDALDGRAAQVMRRAA